MGILERAWKGVIRQPVKSLILLVTVAVLGTLIAGAVSLKQGLAATKKAIEEKIVITAQIVASNLTPDTAYKYPLPDETVRQIAELPQVKSWEFANWLPVYSGELVLDEAGTSTEAQMLLASAANASFLDNQLGYNTLVAGRWLTAEDENSKINPIVISEKMAGKNNISVGSQLTLRTTSNVKFANAQDGLPRVKETYTVVGIYAPKGDYVMISGYSLITYSDTGKIYTVNSAIRKAMENAKKALESGKAGGGLFYARPAFNVILKDRKGVEAFSDAVRAMGLPSDYTVSLSDEAYDNTLEPLENLGWITHVILLGTVVATVALLGLVVSLTLKSRTTEMGILFTLGDRKKRIAAQLLIEIFIITLLGLTVAVFAGGELSKDVSRQMIQNSAEDFLNKGKKAFEYDRAALDEMKKGIEVTIGADTVSLIYLTGLLTAGAATVLPVILTLRQSPKKILLK